MKIKLLSDLHLEFGNFDAGEGDVLILAGDIVNVKEMTEGTPQGKYYIPFLEKCLQLPSFQYLLLLHEDIHCNY